MLSVAFVFAILCFAFLVFFFAGLPNLKTCELPNSRDFSENRRLKEYVPILWITLLYALAAFWNLGNCTSPESFMPMEGESVILDLTSEQYEAEPLTLILFPGVGIGEYDIEYSNDTEGWFPLSHFSQDHVAVLKWQFLSLISEEPFHYLRIICRSGNPWLGEVALRKTDGTFIPFECSCNILVDEQATVPNTSDYHNSSYFDEIYHARTAWEHLHGIWPYEISHPPLGKELLSLGILFFGMTPFGWRFSGTLTGVLMLPVMYDFLMQLFSRRRTALLGTALMAAGFLHFVQTRIATVDSYAVFFILLMYRHMLSWFRDGKTGNLALCGLFFGIGAACKWTCLYAGAGLAMLWAFRWITKMADGSATVRIFLRNCLACILFFLLLPAVIYYLSYIPYGIAENTVPFRSDYTKLVLDNQSFMFHYHASIVAEHPYSSRWYQWIFDIRPILYYLDYPSAVQRVSIAAFVNPLICWGGFLGVLILLYITVARKCRTGFFLLVAYASGLVPWMFISRLTFEYHYFASAVFLVPILCYVFELLERNRRNGRRYTTAFTVFAVLLFLMFFPVLSGLAINNKLESSILSWLPSWPI